VRAVGMLFFRQAKITLNTSPRFVVGDEYIRLSEDRKGSFAYKKYRYDMGFGHFKLQGRGDPVAFFYMI